MRKVKLTGLVVCIGIGVILSGCALFEHEEKKPAPEGVYIAPTKGLKNCKNVEDVGKKMIDSVLRGLSTGNYALYSRDFSEKNKKYFDEKVFDQAHEAVKERLGDYQGIKFIGFWKKGDYEILLWKARFLDTDDDILVQMYVEKTDDTYKIAALKLI